MHELPGTEDLCRLLDVDRAKRGERTIRLSCTNLHRLQDRGYDILSPEATIRRLRESHKPTTVRTYISSLVNYLDLVPEHAFAALRYRGEYARLEAEISAGFEDTVFTEAQRKNMVTWDGLLAAREELAATTRGWAAPLGRRQLKTLYDHLLLCFFTMLPPGRNDYRLLRIVDELPVDAADNYYLKGAEGEGDAMIFDRYKTRKFYGRIRIEVPAPLREAVRASLEAAPRSFVFANFGAPERPWSTQYFSNRMAAVLPDKKLSSCLIRKIVTTEFAKRGKGSRHELARAMRHCIGTSEKCYNEAVRGQGENDMGFEL